MYSTNNIVYEFIKKNGFNSVIEYINRISVLGEVDLKRTHLYSMRGDIYHVTQGIPLHMCLSHLPKYCDVVLELEYQTFTYDKLLGVMVVNILGEVGYVRSVIERLGHWYSQTECDHMIGECRVTTKCMVAHSHSRLMWVDSDGGWLTFDEYQRKYYLSERT